MEKPWGLSEGRERQADNRSGQVAESRPVEAEAIPSRRYAIPRKQVRQQDEAGEEHPEDVTGVHVDPGDLHGHESIRGPARAGSQA